MTSRKLYLLAYDLGPPKQQHQARKELRNLASGQQVSVFECYLSRRMNPER